MAFFDEIGKKITQTGQSAVQKTKDLADIAKLNGMISDAEKKIEACYIQIGKLYCARYADTQEVDFVDLVSSITEAQSSIKQYQNQIQQIKGIVNCPACGAEVAYTSMFCNVCGCRMQQNGTNNAAAQETLRCKECGGVISSGQKFCTSCGSTVENISAETQPVTAENAYEDTINLSSQNETIEAEPQTSAALCPNCQNEISDGAMFCTNCGQRL